LSYSIKHINSIIGNLSSIVRRPADVIEHLLTDSRKVYDPSSSLFFALKGPRRDGHLFIPELYDKGIRNFVVSEKVNTDSFPEANFIFTNDVMQALQQLAAAHRKQFNIPVIGITGSNGKTIVKEWLYQLLHEKFNVVRRNKSYKSQMCVLL
jgi:UDP-N-acetylmuramyl pentapeptide synthase